MGVCRDREGLILESRVTARESPSQRRPSQTGSGGQEPALVHILKFAEKSRFTRPSRLRRLSATRAQGFDAVQYLPVLDFLRRKDDFPEYRNFTMYIAELSRVRAGTQCNGPSAYKARCAASAAIRNIRRSSISKPCDPQVLSGKISSRRGIPGAGAA